MTEDPPDADGWSGSLDRTGWRWVPNHDVGIAERERVRRLMQKTQNEIIASLQEDRRRMRWVEYPGGITDG